MGRRTSSSVASGLKSAMALLLSLTDRELIKRMSVSDHLHVLIIRMMLSMVLCLALTVGSVAFIVIPSLGTSRHFRRTRLDRCARSPPTRRQCDGGEDRGATPGGGGIALDT